MFEEHLIHGKAASIDPITECIKDLILYGVAYYEISEDGLHEVSGNGIKHISPFDVCFQWDGSVFYPNKYCFPIRFFD